MKKQILIIKALFLICAAAISLCACSGGGEEASGSNNNGAASNPGDGAQNIYNGAEPDGEPDDYNYPDLNGNGRDFNVFVPVTLWGFYHDITFDEHPAEILDVAVYNRNRFIEDKFNITIKQSEAMFLDFYNELRQSINAGMDAYDIAFPPAFHWVSNLGSLIAQNLFYDLNELAHLNLDENWWNQTINSEAVINNKLFYAGCDINIMSLQSVMCVYFNKDMIENLGLDMPYDAVREGRWTFDEFNKYMKAGANLNGASSFAWDANSTAVYGLTSYDRSATALLMGAQEKFIVSDEYGIPQIAFGNERFLTVLGRIQEMLTVAGDYIHLNDPVTGSYVTLFSDNRALMLIGELSIVDHFRALETDFGILPVPKFDENQEDYYSKRSFLCPVAVIPVNNEDADFTSAVLDAWAYKSYKDVTPVLFDVSVSHKRLRDEESIEMLQIIRNSGSFDVGSVYGWTSALYDGINNSIGLGDTIQIASTIDREKTRTERLIERTLNLF
jgi:ABC-type glycerol-3-phosphate transport system substrate-binding protein